MKRKRKLFLSICNYKNEVVCDLYDNDSDISGQATNVFITSERNGWKELSFEIPSTCVGAEGEEENYRLQYLIAEYRIRAVEENKLDWFIISEPRITRNAFSKNVEVTAGHVSQLLKHKNLDLEFSDDEGNNVGTAENILAEILRGTDWLVGNVGEQNDQGVWHTFLEDDNSAKKRSLTAQAGTGALALIEKLCDVFEAKPIYRIEEDGNKYVDIVPMNPFAKIEPEQIPALLRDKDLDVLELHYNRNIHDLTKTTNTDNMATRLYAYGSSGDMNGACTLQNAVHYEWPFTVSQTGSEYHFSIGDSDFFFTGNVATNNKLVWSTMDITSMSYIYNNTKKTAYRVYRTPKTSQVVELTPGEPVETPNGFAFLFGLKYYDDVGLMTEEQFQAVAKFQRDMPALYNLISEKNEAYIKGEALLSKIAESNTGFLKLKIREKTSGRYYIDTTAANTEHGVIYRTDYDVAERRYFQWHVAEKLDSRGDPITGTPSMLFVVHNTNPVTYDMTYLKSIWDTAGQVLDDENNPADFEYSTGNYPKSFTVWDDNLRFSSTDRVYLFCTNSMAGLLGSRLSHIEAIYEDLYKNTMQHPVTFYDADSNTVAPTPTGSEYEWRYDYHLSSSGTLWFCWKDKYNETTWKQVYISSTTPTPATGYFYSTRYKTLHRYANSAWQKIEGKDTIVKMFETVIYYCLLHDKLRRGIYEYYYRNGSLAVGNYAIHDGYNAYWIFKLTEAATSNIMLDYTENHQVFDNVTFKNNKPVLSGDAIAKSQSVETRSVIYPSENEIATKAFHPGSISRTTGADEKTENTYYRTGLIPVNTYATYTYFLPSGSKIYFYNSDKTYRYYSSISVTTAQASNFNTYNSYYMKLVVPEVSATSFIRLNGTTEETDNLLKDRPFVPGFADENGADMEVNTYRTETILVYENTEYEYYLPAGCVVFYYDANIRFLENNGHSTLTSNSPSNGRFTTPADTRYIRLVSSTNVMSNYYIRIRNYNKIFYKSREQYTILDNVSPRGELIGIVPLVGKMADVADETYIDDLAVLQQAQEQVKTAEDNLAILLGDMLKDGRWQDSNYIKGDEKRLYDDALYMLKQVSMPEVTYSFTYLDMFGVKNEHYYEDHDFTWPDIDISQTAHLVDTESNTNCWAYIDKVNKCYDQEWKTEVEIDTKLTLASRHNFTDVIARIAEVSKEMKAKQALYDQAVTGRIDGTRIEGAIKINQAYLNGGSSNWYNDSKGNLIFEAADGLSAVQIGGRGIGISTERADDGTWVWRTAATGYGLTADVITAGSLNADRIDAGTITLEKLSSNVGKELEISSNKALMLFATEDGSRPAGSLKTTDGFIEIIAGQGDTPAKINVVSGGQLNLNGGTVNVYSEGEMNVVSGGRFVLKSQNADSMNSTGNGLFIDSEQGINFAGGKFKVEAHGNTMDVKMTASYIELGVPNEHQIIMDSVTKSITINALNAINLESNSTITLKAGKTLNLITGGTINIGQSKYLFTIGADPDTNRAFIYNGISSYDAELTGLNPKGVYIGTDAFALKQVSDGGSTTSFIAANGSIGLSGGSVFDHIGLSTSGDYRIWVGHSTPASAPFYVMDDGTLFTKLGKIANWTIAEKQLSSGSGSGFVALNSNTSLIIGTNLEAEPYAIWAGAENSANATFKVSRKGIMYAKGATVNDVTVEGGSISIHNLDNSQTFSVTSDGVLTATKGSIAGWTIENQKLKGNKAGLAKTNNDNDIAIWAGADEGFTGIYEQRDGRTYLVGYRYAPFRVTQGGAMYATAGEIAEFKINDNYLSSNTGKVGLSSATGDESIAIWAGAQSYGLRQNAKFRVLNNGKMYAEGAEITGSTFVIKNGDTTLFEITNTGQMFIRPGGTGGGWYIDANDFAGPWYGAGGVTENDGYVQLNCNVGYDVRIAVGREGGHNSFWVTADGVVHCRGIDYWA